MSEKTAQLFRKAGRGYNKDDVNEYILSLNDRIKSLTEQYNRLVGQSNKRAEEDFYKIKELNEKIEELQAKNSEELRILKEKAEKSEKENEELRKSLADATEKASAETQKNEEKYNTLCAKAGEVLVVASTTADDILKKANDEALRIVGEAESKKDKMVDNLNKTAGCATEGLKDYIKQAVEDCVKRISDCIKDIK